MSPNVRVDADPTGVIDVDAFKQILELDDDDTHAYSKDIIGHYFAQAPEAFVGMDAALAETDLRTLADLAHFLMGSSATLGIARVAGSCERLEGVGKASLKARDAAADDKGDPGRAAALKQIAALLVEVKREYADAEGWLRRWYADHGQRFDEPKPQPTSAPKKAEVGSESKPESGITGAGETVDAPPQPPPKSAAPPQAVAAVKPPSTP
ncbi:signal transduction histidine kinase [Mycena capillaripes]|nr:signal transduction histidine kinase [Mycena capillaripes]